MAAVDPVAAALIQPSLRPPPPATVGRGRSRDAGRATLGPPRGAALAGRPLRHTHAVARPPARRAETIVGICNTVASCTRRPRPSPTTRLAAGHGHHRPRPAAATATTTTCTAAGHGPPPTTPSRRPRPPPTTPSCCRSAQWVTSDEQPRVTSRKRRSHDDPRRRYARPRPRPSSSGVRTAALDGRDSCSAVRRSENQNEILGEGLRRGPLGCGRRRRC